MFQKTLLLLLLLLLLLMFCFSSSSSSSSSYVLFLFFFFFFFLFLLLIVIVLCFFCLFLLLLLLLLLLILRLHRFLAFQSFRFYVSLSSCSSFLLSCSLSQLFVLLLLSFFGGFFLFNSLPYIFLSVWVKGCREIANLVLAGFGLFYPHNPCLQLLLLFFLSPSSFLCFHSSYRFSLSILFLLFFFIFSYFHAFRTFILSLTFQLPSLNLPFSPPPPPT